MKEILLCVVVTILFLGVGIQPAIAIVDQEKEINGDETKDYLFQVIINIANNPEIKDLLKQYDNNLFELEIDRGFYRKILFRNPRLFRSIIFTRPSLTYEYLDISYKNGIEINNILGEDKVIDTIENVCVTNNLFFDKINNIITKNGLISGSILDFPYICLILDELIKSIMLGWFYLCVLVNDIFGYSSLVGNLILYPFRTITSLFFIIVVVLYSYIFHCWAYP
jgi:hypothetical protein